MHDLIEVDTLIDAHKLVINRYRLLIQIALTGKDKTYLLNICDTALTLTNTDKISRWIGFIQGILYCKDLISIEEERSVTRAIYKPVYDKIGLDSSTVTVGENNG